MVVIFHTSSISSSHYGANEDKIARCLSTPLSPLIRETLRLQTQNKRSIDFVRNNDVIMCLLECKPNTVTAALNESIEQRTSEVGYYHVALADSSAFCCNKWVY